MRLRFGLLTFLIIFLAAVLFMVAIRVNTLAQQVWCNFSIPMEIYPCKIYQIL